MARSKGPYLAQVIDPEWYNDAKPRYLSLGQCVVPNVTTNPLRATRFRARRDAQEWLGFYLRQEAEASESLGGESTATGEVVVAQ